MSHVVTVKTEVRDAAAVSLACRRQQLPPPSEGTHRLFGSSVSGLAVHLPEWRYPVVCQLACGELAYDNYGGRWGDPTHLDAFLQAYAIEKCRIEARRSGHTINEQPLEDGSIKLTIQLRGAS